MISRSPSVDSPPERPWPRKSKAMTPAARLNRLAIRQTRGRCQDSVKPCAMMIARFFGPGRWTASIGTPSSVTRVVAVITGLVMFTLIVRVTGLADRGADGESYRLAQSTKEHHVRAERL